MVILAAQAPVFRGLGGWGTKGAGELGGWGQGSNLH